VRPHPAQGPRRQPHAPLVNASAPDSARGGIITPATTHVSVSSTSSERTLAPRHANVTTGEILTAGFFFFPVTFLCRWSARADLLLAPNPEQTVPFDVAVTSDARGRVQSWSNECHLSTITPPPAPCWERSCNTMQ